MVVMRFKTVSLCNMAEATAPRELQRQAAWEALPVLLELACQNSVEAERINCDQYFEKEELLGSSCQQPLPLNLAARNRD